MPMDQQLAQNAMSDDGEEMNIKDAIKAAIVYEKKVCDVYEKALRELNDKTSSQLLKAIFKDEQYHVMYLKEKLNQFKKEGMIIQDELKSTIPSKKDIEKEIHKLRSKMAEHDLGDKNKVLSKILRVEIETSKFYRDMVDTLPEEDKKLFARFLDIEDAHITLVQAELDHYGNTGFWFDNKEIDMEAGQDLKLN